MTTENAPHRLAARIKDRLAEDARTVEFGIDVDIRDDVIVLRGQVATARRRALIEAVARESASGLRIANDVTVVELPAPAKDKDGTPW
jgi:osmotically-inducible protein OsmY